LLEIGLKDLSEINLIIGVGASQSGESIILLEEIEYPFSISLKIVRKSDELG
jgi:hypothetical protein